MNKYTVWNKETKKDPKYFANKITNITTERPEFFKVNYPPPVVPYKEDEDEDEDYVEDNEKDKEDSEEAIDIMSTPPRPPAYRTPSRLNKSSSPYVSPKPEQSKASQEKRIIVSEEVDLTTLTFEQQLGKFNDTAFFILLYLCSWVLFLCF